MEEKQTINQQRNRGNFAVKRIATAGMIAAIYTVLGIVLAPFNFGIVQVRLGEALTLLPVFGGVSTIFGVTIGCLLTNAYGVITGASILGTLDIVVGTAATLVAAILTYLLRNKRIKGIPFFSALPPVIVNALVIGYSLTLVMSDGMNMAIFWVNFLSVFAGQFVSCVVVGLVLMNIIKKKNLSHYFEK
ncbi:MAG: QueT transporter family protein [Oscillospiraceae bacterium]